MKSTKVLLVTSAYPYGHGETFVKAELDHLSKYFGKIELVPCSFPGGLPPRQVAQEVNLAYAAKRWGALRTVHVLSAFAMALAKYRWRKDLVHIVRHDHRYVNLKELARALYRACAFERFLETQIIKNNREIDLVYFYWMVPEIMGAIGFRQSSRRPISIVSRVHSGDIYEHLRKGNYIGLRESIAEGVDGIYCISGFAQSYLASKYPPVADRLRIARLGVDDPGYVNRQPDDDQLSIVTCSFVVREKRLHLVVAAVLFLLEQEPLLRIKWTHIGDGELFDQLRAEVEEKIGDRALVVFTGFLPQHRVMELYRDERFDVIVNVSDSEGIPVSLMEASSAGIPMIATDVGGNSEIVNAANGILIAADPDIASIAAALLLFRDKPLASAYRKQARSSWEEMYDARKNYDAFGQDLVRLVGQVRDA
jgi:colanic acid/amylovoran biosynthesis glycosyltransferase